MLCLRQLYYIPNMLTTIQHGDFSLSVSLSSGVLGGINGDRSLKLLLMFFS